MHVGGAKSRPQVEHGNNKERVTLAPNNWRAMGLELLAEEGPGALRVSRTARELGVTSGSFYHHFDSIDAFKREVLAYWYAEIIVKVAQEHLAAPEPTFTSLVVLLQDRDLPRYDIAIRQWADTYQPAASVIKKADLYRIRILQRMLEMRGFSAEEARARGEMVIAMLAAILSYDPTRRGEVMGRFVKLIDSDE